MPRFFFNVQDGVSYPDREGTDLPGLPEARQQALQIAGRLLAEDSTVIKLGEDWSINVADVGGRVLFSFDLFIRGAAAVKSSDEHGPGSTLP